MLICGNVCVLHFTEEFTGRFRKGRRALLAISLADLFNITCIGNNYSFVSREIEIYGKESDIFIGILCK